MRTSRTPFSYAQLADSFARLHFVPPGQLGSAALRLVFPGQMFHGSVGPATLDESRRQIRSERLLATGLVSLPACLTAQANRSALIPRLPLRLRSGLRLTGMTKKGCQRHKPPLSCQGEGLETLARSVGTNL